MAVAFSGVLLNTPAKGQEPTVLPSLQSPYYDTTARSKLVNLNNSLCPPLSQANSLQTREVLPRALPTELQSANGAIPTPQQAIISHPIPPALQALEQNRRGVNPSSQSVPGLFGNGYGNAAGMSGYGSTGVDGYSGSLGGIAGAGSPNSIEGMAGAGSLNGIGGAAGAANSGESGDGAGPFGLDSGAASGRYRGYSGDGDLFADLVIVGDQNPYFLTAARSPHGGPPPTPGALGAPLIRQAFKMADNQTPVPVTRLYYSFNYFNDLNGAYNKRSNANFGGVQLYHNMLGYEQAFARDENNVQRASLGVRMPWDQMTYRNQNGSFSQANSIGDISLYSKYLFWYDPDSFNLISGGMMVTTPTGPGTFANARRYIVNQTVFIQPFVGYRYQLNEKTYLQGFSSIEAPANNKGPTIMYNDLQLNYFAYRSETQGSWLRAIVPLYELHVNTPFTHRGYSSTDPFYATDVVSMTWGAHVILGNGVTISSGVGVPVTGVHPYNYEVLCLVNFMFGGGRKDRLPSLPLTPNL